MFIWSIHLHLLSELKVWPEASAGTYVLQRVQDLCPIATWLLLQRNSLKYYKSVDIQEIINPLSARYVYGHSGSRLNKHSLNFVLRIENNKTNIWWQQLFARGCRR